MDRGLLGRSAQLSRRVGQLVLRLRAHPLTLDEIEAPAIVFAPHPDDETLGCGGTIAVKRSRGARVCVAFMTDGSQSHAHLASPRELRSLRQAEARAACMQLGVPEADLRFLDFPDGELRSSFGEAQRRVGELLSAYRPRQLFIPYSLEPPDDHRVTHEVVRAALAERLGALGSTTVYEYPVWYWDHWPWMRQTGWRRGFSALKRARFGLAGLRDLRTVSPIEEVLSQKRRALDAYATQMTHLRGDPSWVTLADVAGGDFLECFFWGNEYFCRSSGA